MMKKDHFKQKLLLWSQVPLLNYTGQRPVLFYQRIQCSLAHVQYLRHFSYIKMHMHILFFQE